MMKIELLNVKYHDQLVGTLSLTPDNKLCAFEYAPSWLADGFSISPLELPLRPGLFLAKPSPFFGNFGIFEDSYGRYLLHKLLQKEGIDDFKLSALDRLSIVGSGGMGALTFEPETSIKQGTDVTDFDLLQEKALEVLKEKQDDDAGLLLYHSGNSGGARPKAIFEDEEGHWLVKFRHTYDPKDMGQQEYHYNTTRKTWDSRSITTMKWQDSAASTCLTSSCSMVDTLPLSGLTLTQRVTESIRQRLEVYSAYRSLILCSTIATYLR